MSESWQAGPAGEGRIGAFLRWWGAELAALIPAALGQALGLSQEILMLIPEGDDFILRRSHHENSRALGLLSRGSVRLLLARRRAAGAVCVLRIPAGLGLRRQASLAVSALSRGFEAVSGEIERQTPFAPDQVYLGYRVEDRPDARGRVTAHLALIPCETADTILRNLAGFNVTPDQINLADEPATEQAGDTVRILKTRRKAPAPKSLLASALVLAILALISPYARNAMILSSLQTQLAGAKKHAAESAALGTKGGAETQLAYLARLRGGRLPAIALLDAVSRALPDNAHLAQFELSGNHLALQGVARAAPELIAPLEALPSAARVEYSAPVLRDPASGLEQFQLTLTLRAAGPAPEAGP